MDGDDDDDGMGWDEDEEMADLFSFGDLSNSGGDGEFSSAVAGANDLTNSIDGVSGGGGTTDLPPTKGMSEDQAADDLFGPSMVKKDSSDSLIDMLDEKGDIFQRERGFTQEEDDILEYTAISEQTGIVSEIEHVDTQDMLDWLDDEEQSPKAPPPVNEKERGEEQEDEPNPGDMDVKKDEMIQVDPNNNSEIEEAEDSEKESNVEGDAETKEDPTLEPEPELEPTFGTLEEAVLSSKSTGQQIRDLFVREEFHVGPLVRPHLWCRSVCGKTMDELTSGSVADSFVEWTTNFYDVEMSEDRKDPYVIWIKNEATILAERIVAGTTPDDPTEQLPTGIEEAKRSLCSVLLHHYKSRQASEKDDNSMDLDPLIPPVACALLSAGIPAAATSVVLSHIMPQFMPLLALSGEERAEAAKTLHEKYYLLACYHFPLLVFHLDRYAPGWYWAKQLTPHPKSSDGPNDENQENATRTSRNLQSKGVVPQSCLISHLAGECGGAFMKAKWLTAVWDLVLVSSNNALRFFLSLAVLETNANTLLMLTGDELLEELNRIMEFKEGSTHFEDFAIEAEEDALESEAVDKIQEWCDAAHCLWQATPRSVVSQLRCAEDAVVKDALSKRQKEKEENLQARLMKEAKEHKDAVETSKERKVDEARARLTRARLVAYYRKYNPEKEENVDKIIKQFEGRLEVLDRKLKAKYGIGFNPALKPKKNTLNKESMKLLSTMSNGPFFPRKKVAEESEQVDVFRPHQDVALAVACPEVLSVVCWSKQGAAKNHRRYDSNVPLKFFLVDSRPEETVLQQGRFPTAVAVGPDMLMDPDKMQLHEDMFESLRGAAHIVIMGEGFEALPFLYGHKLTPKLRTLMEEDDARTSNCALFFAKKGFPFVSVLDGGFAASHAWLSREGHTRFLSPSSVLVDYDTENSMFAKLENAYKEHCDSTQGGAASEKRQRAMQNFVEGSMTSLTKNKLRIDNIKATMEKKKEERLKKKKKKKESVSQYFAKNSVLFSKKKLESNSEQDSKTMGSTKAGESKFQNRLADLRNKVENQSKKDDSDKSNNIPMKQTNQKPLAGLLSKVESLKKKDTSVESTTAPTEQRNQKPLAGLRSKVESLKKKDSSVESNNVSAKQPIKSSLTGFLDKVESIKKKVELVDSNNASTKQPITNPLTGLRDKVESLKKKSDSVDNKSLETESIQEGSTDDKAAVKGAEDQVSGNNVTVAATQRFKMKFSAPKTINGKDGNPSTSLTQSMARFKQAATAKLNQDKPEEAGSKKDRFGALGASLNKSTIGTFAMLNTKKQAGASAQPKKSPFSRFGSKTDEADESSATAKRFAGLGNSMNQMRLNATNAAKVRAAQRNQPNEEALEETETEESISFS